MHIPLALRDRITHLLLANDMDDKLQEARSHLCWVKRLNQRRRSGNGLNMVLLPQNPLRKLTHHPGFTYHDPSRVPAYVLKRRVVSPSLVRPPDDMSMLHRNNLESEVSSIRKSPGRFPSTHKRVLTLIIFINLPRN